MCGKHPTHLSDSMVYYYQSLDRALEKSGLHSSRRLQVLCTLLAILNLSLLLLVFVQPHLSGENPTPEPYIYSPAEDFVSHKLVKFTRGLAGDVPIYEHRRSPAVDAAWEALYSVAQIRMPRSEVVKMPNRTWPWTLTQGQDTLRKELHPGENYTRAPAFHIRHCIGAIRQALMCSVDITSVVWQWSDDLKSVEQRDDVVHVCRDYDRIRDWASQRTYPPEDFDETLYVVDDWYVDNENGGT
ncbi:hypothetical protein C8F04DRAFT_1173256 [Mycena alexandri]|uniref:Uncharacterized protein n=1 Tax=Mycena alexandri TaxID=1745969 RepID=A0AAD6TJW1_9AGAR|nr:hypothetical protein C8F04DRAFT_1173256 [Mycena alexandri]